MKRTKDASGSVPHLQAAIAVLRGLRKARKAIGFTQQEAADMIGVSATTLSRWERDAQDPRSGEALGAAVQLVALVG